MQSETGRPIYFEDLQEGQALVCLEAQACGCPVVASDIHGNRELIEGHVTLMPSGALLAEDLNLKLNGETLSQVTSPYLLHGNIEGHIKTLTYQQGNR